MHADEGSSSDRLDGDYVQFYPAGEPAAGEFRCAGCGYGVTVHRVLPACPMCGGASWEAGGSSVVPSPTS